MSEAIIVSPSDKIQIQLKGHIAQLTLNNPPANTWDQENLSALRDIVGRLNSLPQITALIIHGLGEKFFSAGADLKQFADGDKQRASDVIARFGEAFESLAKFNGVSIAAINGYAMGGGLECALACDVRVIERQAQVALPEATVGLLPGAGGTQRLTWLVGEAWASKMILFGQRLDSATALRIGLAQDLVETGKSLEKAFELAETVKRQSPDAVRACKRLLTSARESAIAAGLEAERTEFAGLMGRANQLEGTNAFLQKRSPEWTD